MTSARALNVGDASCATRCHTDCRRKTAGTDESKKDKIARCFIAYTINIALQCVLFTKQFETPTYTIF